MGFFLMSSFRAVQTPSQMAALASIDVLGASARSFLPTSPPSITTPSAGHVDPRILHTHTPTHLNLYPWGTAGMGLDG